MDILIEVLLDIYMECMFLIIPEEKRTKKHYIWAKVIAILCSLGVLALACWGIVWIWESKNPWGWIPLSTAILFSVVQITLGIILTVRRYRK